jgi:proteasome lid subunit RPN8/RPN11
MKQLKQEVLEQTFEHLRKCGSGRRECVAYLTGPADQVDVIDGVVHPRHTAGAARYDLDSESIARLWSELANQRRSIRVQVHTHPGAAFHSSRDDHLALVHTPGFLSLVIPNFALGLVGFGGAYLAERTNDGRWVETVLTERLQVSE